MQLPKTSHASQLLDFIFDAHNDMAFSGDLGTAMGTRGDECGAREGNDDATMNRDAPGEEVRVGGA